MSYLGKISAIVSANTSDFQSKLAMSGKDVDSWSKSIQSTISRASSKAASSLRGIYTEAQKLDRALKAAQNGTINFKGFEAKNLDAAVSRMQALYSVTKEVNEPLERAARTLEKLPAEIQAGLNAAMQRAQVEAEQLAAEINKLGEGASIDALGKKFDVAAKRAERAAAAVNRLKEAQSLVGGLATGSELRFRAPDFAREVARAKQLQEGAAASPTGNFSGIIERQLASVRELTVAYARMENARATADGDVAGTTAAYERQLATVRQIGTELEQAVVAERAGADAERERAANIQRATGAASRLLQVNQRESTLLSNENVATSSFGGRPLQDRFRAIAESERAERIAADRNARLEREIALNDRLITQERELAQERLRAASASRSTERGQVGSAANALLGPRRGVEQDIGQVYAGLEQQALRFRAAAESAFGLPEYQEFRQQIQRAGGELQSIETEINRLNSLDPQRDIAEYADQWTRVGSRVRQVDEWMRSGVRLAEQAVQSARDRANEEERAARAMNGNPSGGFGPPAPPGSRVLNGVTRVPAEIGPSSPFFPGNRGGNATGDFGPTLPPGFNRERAALLAANMGAFTNIADYRRQQLDSERGRLSSEFAGGTTRRGAQGINFEIEKRSLQGYTEQLRILETNLARASQEARGPASAAFARLRAYIATAFDEGRLDAQATREEIRRLTQEAIRLSSRASGTRQGTLARNVARAGDVGRMGLGNVGLAFNQAAFAVDDFMSATGGIEFKIRAISNNISQLGFVLGGTAGLFAAVGVTLAANVGLFVAKSIGFLEDAEEQEKRTKIAADSLTSSYENQRKTVEALAKAYDDLGKNIAKAVLSGPQQERAEREQNVGDLKKLQGDRRRELIASMIPQVADIRAERARIEGEIAKEPNEGRRFEMRERIERGRQRENRIIQAAEQEAAALVRDNAAIAQPGAAGVRRANEVGLARITAAEPSATRDEALRRQVLRTVPPAVAAQQLKDSGRLASGDLSQQLKTEVESLRARAGEIGEMVPRATSQALDNAAKEVAKFAAQGAATEADANATFDKIFRSLESVAAGLDKSESVKRWMEERDKAAQTAEREASSVLERGREVSMTPAQRASESLAKDIEAIQRHFGQLAAETTGLIDKGGMNSAIDRAREDAARQAAPMLFDFADEVKNAIALGPSRQALTATDSSSLEGQRELNRLLRADDEARNVNIAELQRQTKLLSDIARNTDKEVKVAN